MNLGRTKLWALADIETYEQTHPEVPHETFKTQKMVAFYRASPKGTLNNAN